MSIRKILVPLLYLAASSKMQLSSGLGCRLHRCPRLVSLPYSRKSEWTQRQRSTRLLPLKSDNGDPDERNNEGTDEVENNQKISFATTPAPPDVSLLMDPGLWISDFLAVILASQLIGLLNVLNNPEFIQNGGWLQPIPAVPSTLDELVQRISSFSILWAIASMSMIAAAKTTTRMGESTVVKQNDSDRSDTKIILKKNVQTLVVFCALQIMTNWVVFELGFGDARINSDGFSFEEEAAFPWLDVLRNCYYIGLSTSGLRFLYGRYFLLS